MSAQYALLEVCLDRSRCDVDDSRKTKHFVFLRRVRAHLVEVFIKLGQPLDEFVSAVNCLKLGGHQRFRANGLVALGKC